MLQGLRRNLIMVKTVLIRAKNKLKYGLLLHGKASIRVDKAEILDE